MSTFLVGFEPHHHIKISARYIIDFSKKIVNTNGIKY